MGLRLRRWAAILPFLSLILLLDLGGIEESSSSVSSDPSSIPFSWEFPRVRSALVSLRSSGTEKTQRRLEEGEEEPSDSVSYSSFSSSPTPLLLEYDFYREKCPQAEEIIRSTVTQLFSHNASVAPALLRLLFHDCFIHGCDASVLLDRINASSSERDAIPNHTLKGFDAIDTIKSNVEKACPATVSCADILVLAARDGVVLAGGPFYPVLTGRRDSERSFYEDSQHQIPGPNDTYAKTLANFASRGFSERETVSLLGAHSIGTMHCKFFEDRLYNFSGMGEPDGSLDGEMVAEMRAACGGGEAAMGYRPPKGGEQGRFGNHYYDRLLEGRGILRADQQLTAGRTVRWVKAYAAEGGGGLRDFLAEFARAMVKMSSLGPPAGERGQIRVRCSQVVVSSGIADDPVPAV